MKPTPSILVFLAALALVQSMGSAQEPAESEPATFELPPVVVRPKVAPPRVKWESPVNGTLLFRPDSILLDWSSTCPDGTVYTVALARDKTDFDQVVVPSSTVTNAHWELPDLKAVNVWLKVKAISSSNELLWSDTISLRLLPKDAVIVSKSNQRLWALKNGSVLLRYLVSTGMKDMDTRDGWFSVLWRSKLHHSKEYDVDMPFALFFSGGQAIHASTALRRLGRPASHGCVRLPRDHARELYEATPIGRPVIVTPWGQDMSYLDAFVAKPKPTSQPKTASAAVPRRPAALRTAAPAASVNGR